MKKRILFTDRELDTTFSCVASALIDTFDIYITYRSKDESIKKENGVTYLPLEEIRSKFQLSVIKQIRKYNSQYKFDIIFSPSSSGLSNALIATIGSKTKNIGYRGTGAKIRRLDPTYYLGILNPRLKHVICETKYVKDYLKNFIRESKLSVLTKPFSLQWVESAKNDPIYPTKFEYKKFKIITVANTKGRPYKGLTTLIEAMHIVNDENIVLTIVGNFDDHDYKLAQENNGDKYITFVGEQKNGINYIAGSDLYVLPSYRDASPRVVREAMALGKPTIVSDIDGSRELIEPNETGILCKSANAKALAEAIVFMSQNRDKCLEMGQKGRERIATEFSFDKYCTKFKEILYNLLDKN